MADVDQMDESEDRITLMTLHSAKGLEFPVVYLSGMEDGLFPNSRTILSEDPTDLEEERRLCYVGITRARERLVLTASRTRMNKGEIHYSRVSRFVDEIPEELLEKGKPAWMSQSDSRKKAESRESSGGGSPFQRKDAPWSQKQQQLGVSTFGSGGGKAPGFGREFTVQRQKSLDYGPGDRVRHIKFGEGTVESVADGAKDFEVTVNFDRCGIKKMFASFAKLQRL